MSPRPVRVQIRGRRRRGAAAVEFAIVLVPLLLLVFGLIEMSRLGMAAQMLTTAAREGCRTAVIEGNTLDDVTTRMNTYLDGAGITPADVEVALTPTNWASAPRGTTVTVALRVAYRDISWIPNPFFLADTTVSSSASFSSERP